MPASVQTSLPLLLTGLISGLILLPSVSPAEPPDGIRPLLATKEADLASVIPPGARLLHDPRVIEEFLDALDGAPPDWATIYGPDGKGHDDRLFELNRRRDGRRRENPAPDGIVTFLWSGELSAYEPRAGGFRVAIGPEMIATRWGLVRFKPEGLPAELIAIPSPDRRESLRRKLAKGKRVEVKLAMTGRLVPEESLIYDFAHEEPGRGMIMPVVRVERVDYLLIR